MSVKGYLLNSTRLFTFSFFNRNLSLVPEEDEEQQQYEYQEQNDILTRLPYELALYIFSLLCFEDLVRVQLTCRLWCRIAHDSSLWKARCLAITQQHTDLSFDDFQCNDEQNDIQQRIRQRRTRLSWPTRYCQLQTKLNWKLGAVQQVHLINQHCGRILSVKLKENMLAALSEVSTYIYSIIIIIIVMNKNSNLYYV
ncbi:uncharacterized protein BX664DRAFT_109 [Halteromyces radiatus]|uniref:uncharacterized protein n=1 Tax=Halteromyces radiatus TaxID=101107 RepID=UPI002220863B|nr:uncharacterized protein BX664DRAFT_109 [Halteromyces radiatus]KAI8098454.1 hypothetical protein BX664DRAFT_109 [Halteromyces radiatus]